MNRKKYNELVDNVERTYAGQPELLLRKTVWLARLSIAFLFLLIFTILLALAFAVWLGIQNPERLGISVLIGIFSVLMLFSISLTVWVHIELPIGLCVDRHDLPKLFELLDELTERVSNIKIDRVFIDGDFNASIMQKPRLGIFGWHQSILLIGLPLMHTLEPDEFRAVLAHEFAHLSNRDGARGGEIYLMRQSWEASIHALQMGGGSAVLMPFLKWFWPRFNAHAFVLSRLQEYRADRISSEIVGEQVTADALLRTALRGRWVEEEVWPNIFRHANTEETPPTNVLSLVCERASAPIDQDRRQRWLRLALETITDRSDTHPALKDRLKAIYATTDDDAIPNRLPPISKTAAHQYLGANEESLISRLNKLWHKEMLEFWTERHESVQKIRQELGPEEEATSLEIAWEWACAMEFTENTKAAMPWVEKVLSLNADHLGARFLQASHRMEIADPRGVEALVALSKLDELIAADAIELLRQHYLEIGANDRVNQLDERADELDEFYQKSDQERMTAAHTDFFVDAELSDRAKQKLVAMFEEEKDIASVLVARKRTKFMADLRMYVFTIEIKAPAISLRSNTYAIEIVQRLIDKQSLVGSVLYMTKDMSGYRKLVKVIAATPNSKIYSRE